jgi:putative transposase
VKRVILTYRYRIKDATTAKRLRAHARAVNYVWNYCGEIQEAARRQEKGWPSAFDLVKLTTGSSALLGLHSDTVQAVCKQFVANRNAARRRPHWRGKESLGWIPFAPARAVKLDGDAVIYLKRRYRLWRSRPVDGKIKTVALRKTRVGAGIPACKSRLLRARPAEPAKLASISA